MPLTREIALTVWGDPAPKGSLKCIGGKGRHQLVEDSDRSTPWRARVADGGRRVVLAGHRAGSDPVGLEITSTITRPKSHYGTGRNAGTLKGSAPLYPSRRASQGVGGDVDKLARLVLDALEDAGVYDDDSQVVELVTRKTYADGPGVLPDALPRPGVRVRLYPL